MPGRLRLQGRPEPHLGRFGCGKHCAVRRHHSAAVLLREQAAPPMGIQQLLHQNAFGQHLFWRHHSRHALPGRQLCRGPGIGGNRGDPPQRSGPGGFPGDARVQRREPGGPRGQGSDRGQGHGLQRRYGIRFSGLGGRGQRGAFGASLLSGPGQAFF